MPNERQLASWLREMTPAEIFGAGFRDATDGVHQPGNDKHYTAGYRAGKKALREALAAYMKESK